MSALNERGERYTPGVSRIPKTPRIASFATRVVRWQSKHGRHDLPWQGSRDPYRIWVSEIMLQQTQVSTVIAYFTRFMARFPDVAALARASEDEVLAHWSGLGYYARARNLQRAAREVLDRHGGVFPHTFDALVSLPGIGRSTAAAIAAFANGERRAILDGNVRRVLARHAGIAGPPAGAAVAAQFWRVAESRLPERNIEAYTQGLMDLGATVCTTRNPACATCPVASDCIACLQNRQNELPGRRRRAPVVKRSVAMLVVVSRGEVLLEKRPPSGIWGGLWSLPEAPDARSVRRVAAREWGITADRIEPLEDFEHAFTHFTLRVSPCRVHAAGKSTIAANRSATWLALTEIEGAALPSPVRKLLRRLVSAA